MFAESRNEYANQEVRIYKDSRKMLKVVKCFENNLWFPQLCLMDSRICDNADFSV